MRLTGAYQAGAIGAILTVLYFGFTFNWVVGLILGTVLGFAAYKVWLFIEDLFIKGTNTALYSRSRPLVEEMLATAYSFDTSADKEEIIANFLHKYPEETPYFGFKDEWACARGNDSLFFITGVRSLADRESKAPMCIAQLSFQPSETGRTTASFGFCKYQAFDNASAPFSKQMAELVRTVKDTFIRIDADCIINENKQS